MAAAMVVSCLGLICENFCKNFCPTFGPGCAQLLLDQCRKCFGLSTNSEGEGDQEPKPKDKGEEGPSSRGNEVQEPRSSEGNGAGGPSSKRKEVQEPSTSGGNGAGGDKCNGPSSGGNQGIYSFVPAEQFKNGIEHSRDARCWKWISLQNEPRLPEAKVAELVYVYWFTIEAKISLSDWKELVSQTEYGVYLIFKTNSWTGLDVLLQAQVKREDEESKSKLVCLKPSREQLSSPDIGKPAQRTDGWMELELGRFFCDDPTRKQKVVVTLNDPDNANEDKVKRKEGLIIAGLELRPV